MLMPDPASSTQPIAVAMSGGVDSSTVAALLVSQGHTVVGLTMQLWNQRRLPELSTDAATGRCCSLDDVYDARHVAEQLAIPYYVVNFEKQFETQVVEPFVSEYLAGRTPIPCTLCNNFIKFDQFLDMADGVGAAQIATGHYARVTRDPVTGRHQLRRAIDAGKDQTYFLFGLTQRQLARTLFPLGEMKKAEVRALARQMHLAVAEKDESYEICFVPNGDYAAFMDAYLHSKGREIEERHGEIVSHDGRALGEHTGVHHFTVGQRRGLGIAAGEPLYVISTDPATQRVTVGTGDRLYLRGRPRGAGAGRSEDPQQARSRRGHPLSDCRARQGRGAFRRATTRRHPRAGRGFLRWRFGSRRRMDRMTNSCVNAPRYATQSSTGWPGSR
jgi:tRNA-specific 2-thiouridylase